MTADRLQRQITGGPSREKLFDALRLRHEEREVFFNIEWSGARRFKLDSIGIEDGSGNNWLLKLYSRDSVLGSQHLECYYNTTLRSGWMRPA